MNIISAKALTSAINSIAKAGAKLDTNVHDATIQAMMHAKEYGDVTHLTRLFYALPKQARAKSFKFYVTQFCPVYWAKSEKDGKLTEGFKLTKDRTEADWKIGAASEVTFWNYTKEVTAEDFTAATLVKRLASLVKTITDKGDTLSANDKAYAMEVKAGLEAFVKKVPVAAPLAALA